MCSEIPADLDGRRCTQDLSDCILDIGLLRGNFWISRVLPRRLTEIKFEKSNPIRNLFYMNIVLTNDRRTDRTIDKTTSGNTQQAMSTKATIALDEYTKRHCFNDSC